MDQQLQLLAGVVICHRCQLPKTLCDISGDRILIPPICSEGDGSLRLVLLYERKGFRFSLGMTLSDPCMIVALWDALQGVTLVASTVLRVDPVLETFWGCRWNLHFGPVSSGSHSRSQSLEKPECWSLQRIRQTDWHFVNNSLAKSQQHFGFIQWVNWNIKLTRANAFGCKLFPNLLCSQLLSRRTPGIHLCTCPPKIHLKEVWLWVFKMSAVPQGPNVHVKINPFMSQDWCTRNLPTTNYQR